MTAAEVMNSSLTMNASTGPPEPVRNQSLEMVVEHALAQLRQLTLQRQAIAQRIAIIKRTINGLALLYLSLIHISCNLPRTANRRVRD